MKYGEWMNYDMVAFNLITSKEVACCSQGLKVIILK